MEALRFKTVDLGHEFPRELHGIELEVVAEAEVAQHLEGRAVAHVADFFDVGGAETALDGHSPWAGRRLLAHEHGLELLHAGARKHRSRVPNRDQRPRWQVGMAAFLEEGNEGFAYLVGSAGWV